jgi:ribosome maturation factor RimP
VPVPGASVALPERIRDAALPVVEGAALDLVDVVVRGEGARRLVRVVVDRKGGVDLARCERVSHDLGPLLDAMEDLDAGYLLEVTSPGVDAPLRDRRAFDRVEGRPVRVQLRRDDGRTEHVDGTVRAAEEDAVVLGTDGGELRVPYDAVVLATQRLPW